MSNVIDMNSSFGKTATFKNESDAAAAITGVPPVPTNEPVFAEAPSLEWLVFQLCPKGPSLSEEDWFNVFPEDLPAWVLEESVVKTMRTGNMVSGDEKVGRMWFRVIRCAPPKFG